MSIRFLYLIAILKLSVYPLNAQAFKTQSIIFHPTYNNLNLQMNDTFYKLNNSDSIQFESLKWYISTIELLNDNKIIWKEENSFHLLDATDKASCQLSFQIPSALPFNQISFKLGIDSITNVSGALGGDLDPTRGMYWTWQSGYINFKLEGKSNKCNTRNHAFQFHLGGYQYPFNALQSILLQVPNNEKIEIDMDLSKWIWDIDLSKQNHIMSPGADAVFLSKKLAQRFSVRIP